VGGVDTGVDNGHGDGGGSTAARTDSKSSSSSAHCADRSGSGPTLTPAAATRLSTSRARIGAPPFSRSIRWAASPPERLDPLDPDRVPAPTTATHGRVGSVARAAAGAAATTTVARAAKPAMTARRSRGRRKAWTSVTNGPQVLACVAPEAPHH